MSKVLIRNRQRRRKINLPLLRRIASLLLDEQVTSTPGELGVHLLSAPAMARMNKEFLQHAGPTDVITFDYSTPAPGGRALAEIFICVEVAIRQAGQFGVPWQEEIVRYLVHGLLHLKGYNDLHPADRRRMKKEENRLVRLLSERFPLRELSRELKVAP